MCSANTLALSQCTLNVTLKWKVGWNENKFEFLIFCLKLGHSPLGLSGTLLKVTHPQWKNHTIIGHTWKRHSLWSPDYKWGKKQTNSTTANTGQRDITEGSNRIQFEPRSLSPQSITFFPAPDSNVCCSLHLAHFLKKIIFIGESFTNVPLLPPHTLSMMHCSPGIWPILNPHLGIFFFSIDF